MAEVVSRPERYRAEEEIAEARLAQVRARIRKYFPDERSPLQWRRDTPNRLLSTCGRFAIEKSGEGDAVRYDAKLKPSTIIGHRRYTLEQAKEDCNRHASPLPLEGPP